MVVNILAEELHHAAGVASSAGEGARPGAPLRVVLNGGSVRTGERQRVGAVDAADGLRVGEAAGKRLMHHWHVCPAGDAVGEDDLIAGERFDVGKLAAFIDAVACGDEGLRICDAMTDACCSDGLPSIVPGVADCAACRVWPAADHQGMGKAGSGAPVTASAGRIAAVKLKV